MEKQYPRNLRYNKQLFSPLLQTNYEVSSDKPLEFALVNGCYSEV